MISKEEFLQNTTEEEVFCIVEEFLERLKEHRTSLDFIVLDKEKNKIIREMIRSAKESIYL